MGIFNIFNSDSSADEVVSAAKAVQAAKETLRGIEAAALQMQKAHKKALKELSKLEKAHDKIVAAHKVANN